MTAQNKYETYSEILSMEFHISKILYLFIMPLGLSLIFIMMSVRWSYTGRKAGAVLFGLVAILVLWISAMPVFTKLIYSGLEEGYPYTAINTLPDADAIVVLGGGVSRTGTQQDLPSLGLAINRLFYGMKLYQAHKAPRIILSGGGADGEITEAKLMADLLKGFGISGNMVIEERISRNTHDNAMYTLAILHREQIQTIILVTSAYHMRRAFAAFRTSEFQIIPAPVDHMGVIAPDNILNWLPDAGALLMTSIACKEYVGWIYYRLRGWIKD
jgi:uncharacterized SAM-binding protein YcdF (DUF218 family)